MTITPAEAKEKKPMTVLICGGRDFNDKDAVWRALDAIAKKHFDDNGRLPRAPFNVICGGCPTGADHHAIEWAIRNWVNHTEYLADWRLLGKAAGPIRNQRMIDEGKPDLVVAFPGGRGTADMVRKAKAAGVTVIEVKERTP